MLWSRTVLQRFTLVNFNQPGYSSAPTCSFVQPINCNNVISYIIYLYIWSDTSPGNYREKELEEKYFYERKIEGLFGDVQDTSRAINSIF